MTSSYLRIQTDHCRRGSCTSAFRKNIKELPRDHFHTCIVVSACDPETPSPQTSKSDYWIGGGDRCKNDGKVIFDDRRQSPIVDEWATRQARGMISSIEKQAREAELLALSSLHPVSARACSFQREMSPVSPTLSDCSSELSNLRTSSLVQMWRDLESEARIAKTKIGSMSSDVSCRTYLASNTDEEASGGSEVCNSVDERSDTEWESDCITPRAPPPLSVPNGGESETVRVAVMVKRLSLRDQARNSLTPQDEICQQRFSVGESYDRSIPDQRGDIVLLSNRNYPRVRGHAATRDLLARMEMERRNDIARLSDRRAVSQFSHRSRIQALLRFRFLWGAAPVHEQQRPASTAFELKQLKQHNTILELRERFNSTNHQASRTVPATDRPSGLRQFQNNVMDSEDSVLGKPSKNNNRHRLRVAERDNEITLKEQHSLSSISEELQEEASPSADVASQEKSLLYGSHSPKISGRNHEISSLVPNSFQYTAAENLQEEEEADQSTYVPWQEINLSAGNHECQGTMNTAESLTSQEGDMPMVESDCDSPQHIGEPESDNQQPIGETDGNWFGNTSHPWRGWSGHREPIYTNWPESTLQNMEICELLERRPVSTALSSDFRARMEWVMSCYIQRQRTLSMANDSYGEEEDADHPDHVQEDNEVINANQLVSTSVQLPLPSQLFHQQEIQQPSLADESSHYSLEMEVVEKLRGEMERLHWEMSELRKSIDSCMNMQVELQNAIKNDISATAFHSSGASTERLQLSKQAQVTVKGICCICCEMQVDSLLYRCGHMCTCFKCAHELQWSTGRCPICRSPIVDVVRAFSSDQ